MYRTQENRIHEKMESENPISGISFEEGVLGSGSDAMSPFSHDTPRIAPKVVESPSQGRNDASFLEKERNFYRAKCRRLVCERDKLVRT